jgi:hypothetical protein
MNAEFQFCLIRLISGVKDLDQSKLSIIQQFKIVYKYQLI